MSAIRSRDVLSRRSKRPIHHLHACSTAAPSSWGEKRARGTRNTNKWRDWGNLPDGPAGLIAERVLAGDVADYIRLRAVCRLWRRCCAEPPGGLDPRFHPRRWIMLRDSLAAAPRRRRFLNASTGECIQVDLPELGDHEVLSVTPEGILVLFHERHARVRLLNPLTRHLTELPPLATLLLPPDHPDGIDEIDSFSAWGSGIANDDSTVMLCFDSMGLLGIAKPGDKSWTSLKYSSTLTTAPLMFRGRFCLATSDGVMALETSADQQPRLEVAAKLRMRVPPMADTVHLVDNGGELVLVHTRLNKLKRRYDTYRVDLDAGKMFPVKTLGGRALFIGPHCSLSVSTEVFPSIAGDTIYLNFDVNERPHGERIQAYHLADRRTETATYNLDGSVPQPHTLVDCLSWCNTVRDSRPFP